jgi:hypothetical protein
MYLNGKSIYFKKLHCIWMFLKHIWMFFSTYLNVFPMYLKVFTIYLQVFMLYFIVFIMYFNVFQCIYWHCDWYLLMSNFKVLGKQLSFPLASCFMQILFHLFCKVCMTNMNIFIAWYLHVIYLHYKHIDIPHITC